jgi:signal transduction histidine kinase
VARALAGGHGTMNYRLSPDEPERSASYIYLPRLRLAVVMTQPAASTMLVPAHTLEAWLFGLLAGSILLAWGLSTAMSQRVARPIAALEHHLHELARQEVRPERIGQFPGCGVRELDSMVASVDSLYSSLARTIGELEQLDRQRAEFLNILSHDLRIPLTVIVGYAEMLQEAPTLSAEEREHVEALLATCQRMEAMLNELLEYARLEAGRLQLACQPTDLGALLNDMRGFFALLAQQKGLSLDVQASDALPEVPADPERIRQVLVNLVSNAIKYTPTGGHVTLRACRCDGQACLEVEDSGLGLSAEDRRHLFEKFYRSSRPEVQREKGTGLGLVIARGIAEAHGGHLEVDSEEGHGSTFRLTLPLVDGTGDGAGPHPRLPAPPPPGGGSVL